MAAPKRHYFALALLLVGMLCLALGFLGSNVIPSKAYWSEQQAEEYADAQHDAHAKSHHHEHESAVEEAEYQEAMARFERISQQLEEAQSSRDRVPLVLKAVGVVAVLCGVVLHYAGRGSGA
ncbi:MAG: hypothetical protein IT425_14585 [Pirellulales bacterium]|nr:hypothetical protein [Pirellulales bacterium]